MPEPRCCSSPSIQTKNSANGGGRSRRRRARRRVAVLAVFAISAAVVALGASFLNGRSHPAATPAGAVENPSGGAGTGAAPAEPEPVPLPDEIRGVHVTMALASLDGKLDEYFALTSAGLNTLELDVKDENGEVGFQRGAGARAADRRGAAVLRPEQGRERRPRQRASI